MNYYNEITKRIIDNEITKAVKNHSIKKSELTTYYNVGKLLVQAEEHYGKEKIKEYSDELIKELGSKYSVKFLSDMKELYLFSKIHPLDTELTLSQYKMLFTLIDYEEIDYYINQVKIRNLDERDLGKIIKNNEYKKLFK